MASVRLQDQSKLEHNSETIKNLPHFPLSLSLSKHDYQEPSPLSSIPNITPPILACSKTFIPHLNYSSLSPTDTDSLSKNTYFHSHFFLHIPSLSLMPETPQMYPKDNYSEASPTKGYALSGKIMLSAIIILFAVVVFVVCLHIYARWYLLRARRRNLRRRRTTAHLVFYVDPNNPNATATTVVGLDASVLSSLPVFVYSSKTHPDALECAVCLSEFEENEKGRLLPKCNHSFHINCIDMWFHSHSTCPLCRSPVELAPVHENRFDVVVTVDEPGSSSGLCSTCQHDEEMTSLPSSSLGNRRKGLDLTGVTVEIPRRNESDIESAVSSPASRGFKSPVTRFLRILSMNRRSAAVSPSSGVGTSCGAVGTELDMERGLDESTQQKWCSAAEVQNSHATTM